MSTFKGLFQHLRLAGEITPGSVTGTNRTWSGNPSSPSAPAAARVARVARFHRDPAFTEGPQVAFAVWLGSKTGASKTVSIDLNGEYAALSSAVPPPQQQQRPGASSATQVAVLVLLTGNSTTGIQSLLPITGGKVTVTATEVPCFVLVGVGIVPQHPSGPVPYVTLALCFRASRFSWVALRRTLEWCE